MSRRLFSVLSRGAALAWLSLAVAIPAEAVDTRVAATNTAIVEVRADNHNASAQDDNYQVFIDRLNLSGNAGDITAGLRLDTIGFINQESDNFRSLVRLERINVDYDRGDWTLTAGDFYQQLGRGIVLAVRKVDEAALDISLRGGRIEYGGGDHRAMVLAGTTNSANIDAINQRYLGDPRDTVVGWSYEMRALERANLSTFGAYLDVRERQVDSIPSSLLPEDDPLRERSDYSISQSVAVDMPDLAYWFGLYIEGGGHHRQVGGEVTTGSNIYGTADIYAGMNTTLLFEGIWLDHHLVEGSSNAALSGDRFRLNQAPTLMPIDQEVLNAQTVYGGRFKVDQRIDSANLDLWASATMLLNEFNEPNELLQTQGFVGLKWTYDDGASVLTARGGYRDETLTNGTRETERDGVSGTLTNQWQQVRTIGEVDINWVEGFGDGNAFHMTLDSEFRTIGSGSGREDQRRGSLYAGVDRSGLGGITLEWGYDTSGDSQPELLRTGDLNLFLAGIVKWEASDVFTLTATGGTQRGGLKCYAGVCRIYPPFAGGRIELVARF